MEKTEFIKYLVEQHISNNTIKSIIEAGISAEEYLEISFEELVKNDSETLHAINLLRKVDKSFGLSTQYALKKYYEYQNGKALPKNYDNEILYNGSLNLFSSVNENHAKVTMMKKSINNYYYVSLTDASSIIRPEPFHGYLSLLAEIYGREDLIAYSIVLDFPDLFFREQFQRVISMLNGEEQLYITNYYWLQDAIYVDDTAFNAWKGYSKDEAKKIHQSAIEHFRQPSISKWLPHTFCYIFETGPEDSYTEEELIDFGGNTYSIMMDDEFRCYSDLMLRLQIPECVRIQMIEKGINTIEGLGKEYERFPKDAREIATDILYVWSKKAEIIAEYEK